MLDSKVRDVIVDGGVPHDVTADFLNETKGLGAIADIIIVMALTSITVLGRFLSRAFLIRWFGFDDVLAVLSWITFIPFVALCIKLIQLGSGRHLAYIQYVLDVPTVELTQILDVASRIIYTTALLLCRISGLASYYRLCRVHRGLLRGIKVVDSILVAAYLPQPFLIVFHCIPVTGIWSYHWQPGFDNHTCLQFVIVYSVNSSISLVCDLLLFGIPVVMLRVLDMPRKRKIQLTSILFPGILATVISITRLVFLVLFQHDPDMTWRYSELLAVEVSEIGATLIALSVPGIKPLVDKIILRRDASEVGSSAGRHKAVNSIRGTALRSLNLHPEHHSLGSRDASAEGGINRYRNLNESKDNQSEISAAGILVEGGFQI